MEGRYGAWQKALEENRIGDAYMVMSKAYREVRSLEGFRKDLGYYGDAMYHLSPGYHLRVYGSGAWLYPYHAEFGELRSGPEFEWEKVEGTWYFTGRVTVFLD